MGSENRTVVTSLVPYYDIGGQRKAGAVMGQKNALTGAASAKDGYGVSKMEVWQGMLTYPRGALDRARDIPPPRSVIYGVRLTFARMQVDGTLDPADSYLSPLIGESFGNQFTLDTFGVVACGVSGVYNNALPYSIALLVSSNLVKSVRPAAVPGAPAVASTIPGQPLSPVPSLTPNPPVASTTTSTTFFGTPIPAPAPTLTPEDAAAAAARDARLNELCAKAGLSFAFVEGQEGAGSAFICDYQGKRMLFTNQHVVRENPQLKFTMLDQSQVKFGTSHAAVGHDLIGFELSDPLPALNAEMDFAADVSIGDEVVVVGNTEGERVIKPLPGKIAGLGPNLVEVTSEFKPGNSGSPIIHVKSGRVVGIATYAVIRTVDSLTGKREPSVRRFGYRLDSVQQWQPVNWTAYQAEAAATTKVHAFSSAMIQLLRDLRNPDFDFGHHTDPRLQPALSFLRPLITRSNKNATDIQRAVQNFLGELKNVSQRDVEATRSQLRYDFFQRELAEESKFRAELSKALGEAVSGRR
jgi:hypothetical protein